MSLLRKTKKSYFGNLKSSDVCDNKKFWKLVNTIALIESNAMVSEEAQVSEIFNQLFGSAVKNLEIPPSYEPLQESIILSDDPILNIIGKYKDHPSILKINEVIPRESFFSTNIATVMKEISNLNVAKSCPIDSIPSKILK